MAVVAEDWIWKLWRNAIWLGPGASLAASPLLQLKPSSWLKGPDRW